MQTNPTWITPDAFKKKYIRPKNILPRNDGVCQNMTLTKADLIEAISERLDLSPTEARELLKTFLETMKSTLASGEDLMISGFGKFQVKDKATRKGRNPATGETMKIEKRRVVTFKCSGGLRDKLNEL
jgi:integration host factor subunit alpha